MDLLPVGVAVVALVAFAGGYTLGQRVTLRGVHQAERVVTAMAQQRNDVAIALGLAEYEHDDVLESVRELRQQELGLPSEVR